jgi:hypothetical protein
VEEFADSKNGQIAYIEGIMIDITQQDRSRRSHKRKEYAEAANKAKSEFS